MISSNFLGKHNINAQLFVGNLDVTSLKHLKLSDSIL